MHRLREWSNRSPIDESPHSSSSGSVDSWDDQAQGHPFQKPETSVEPTQVKEPFMASSLPTRIGRNRYTYSKGGATVVGSKGDFHPPPTAKYKSWKRVPKIGDVQSLADLLDMSPSDLVFTLVLMGEDVNVLLRNASLDHVSLTALLKVLMKACNCIHTHHLRLLLAAVALDSEFLQQVEQQLVCRSSASLFWNQYIMPLVVVLEKAVELLPREKKRGLFGITAVLLDLVNGCLRDTKTLDMEIIKLVEKVGMRLAEASRDDIRQFEFFKGAPLPFVGDMDEEAFVLPKDFVPGTHLNNSFEKHHGSVSTTADYLNTQYYSLRHQFLSPLRERLVKLQAFPLSNESHGVVIYTNVKIGQTACVAHGVGQKVNFNIVDCRGLESQLLVGSMVCLSKDNFRTIILGTVLWRKLKDNGRGHVVLSFFDQRLIDSTGPSRGFAMIESPEFYLNYCLIFEVLKRYESLRVPLPLRQYLIDGETNQSRPCYMNSNTVVDLKRLFGRQIFVRPLRERDWPGYQNTQLDSYQYDALHAVLSSELTLVEGFPGSGKTFFMAQVVHLFLDNKDICETGGPVVLLTEDDKTLHTLMELVDSDSKVNAAQFDQAHPQRFIHCHKPRTDVTEAASDRLLLQHNKELEQLRSRISLEQEHVRRISSIVLGESELKSVMSDQHYRSLFFNQSIPRDNVLGSWLQTTNAEVVLKYSSKGQKCLTDDEVCYVSDVWDLDMASRYRLYNYWKSQYMVKRALDISSFVERYKIVLKLQSEVQEEMQAGAICEASVVGATVSSLPKVWKALRSSRPRIIIVQGSREIPESFLLPAITLDPHHMLLVADTENNCRRDTETEQSSGTLFDRLLQQGVACNQLLGQHRLSQQSVKILEAFKRKELFDRHEYFSTSTAVHGMSCNANFVDHDHCYRKDNLVACSLEAEYVTSLAKYLLLQGYRANQVTVYASDKNQAELIKSNMLEMEEVPVVDTMSNARSTKNDIVLASFANTYSYSDNQDYERFHYHTLASSTNGLFVIANLTYLAERFQVWKRVRSVVEAEGILRPLELVCQLHPDKRTCVASAKDFTALSDGCCNMPCDALLSCGHSCPKTCHFADRDHKEVRCSHPCRRLLPCDHSCKASCGQPCQERCGVMVNVLSPCDHVVRVECNAIHDHGLVRSSCRETCGSKMSRGVKCAGVCGDCYANASHPNDSRLNDKGDDTSCAPCVVM